MRICWRTMIQSERGGTDESQYSLHFPPSSVSAGFRAPITKPLPQTSLWSCQVPSSYRVLYNIPSTLRIRFLWATSNRKLNHVAWTAKMFVLLLNPSPEVNSAKDNSMAQTYHPRLVLFLSSAPYLATGFSSLWVFPCGYEMAVTAPAIASSHDSIKEESKGIGSRNRGFSPKSPSPLTLNFHWYLTKINKQYIHQECALDDFSGSKSRHETKYTNHDPKYHQHL